MFHISDLKKFNRCPHFYFKDLEAEKEVYPRYIRMDEMITSLALEKLGVKEYFLGERNDPYERTKEALEQYEWLVKARFEHEQLRIKVPFLHRVGDAWDLYFLWIGLYPLANDMQFYCDNVWVLEQEGIKLNHIYLIHLNADYVRKETLDLDELFVISECFYNKNHNPSISVKEAIEENYRDLSPLLDRMEHYQHDELGEPVRGARCLGRQRCRFYYDCFPEEKEMPDNSILTLITSQHKYAMLEKGITYLKDADLSLLEGTPQQYAQIMADRNGGLYVDQNALGTWLQQISYPIAFLDFEWDRYAIPPYKGMKPYDVLPFEFSLHVLSENGDVDHKVYLSVHDDRRELAETLCAWLPKEGSIIAYNAFGAEAIRIEELANQFADLKATLLDMNTRMIDLQEPFLNGVVYDTRMRGQWSLKTIMSFMNDKSYQDLDISQGMDAVFEWRLLDSEEVTDEKERIIEGLKAYCGMDTYSMLIVYQWLLDLL
ncbi:MAG: DUF2779 domain-containing protein [Solobacterium sp.]|nr:DUF2779 domain-containing protein [Solobacterium sp.]